MSNSLYIYIIKKKTNNPPITNHKKIAKLRAQQRRAQPAAIGYPKNVEHGMCFSFRRISHFGTSVVGTYIQKVCMYLGLNQGGGVQTLFNTCSLWEAIFGWSG